MHKFYKYLFIIFSFCFLISILLLGCLFYVFKNWNIEIFNQTDENFMGKIEFFQHKNLLHSEKFEISQNEKKKITVPDDFNDGDIRIFIEDNFWKEEFVISNDYLYSFNVNEKVFIKKENGGIKLEKNP